MHRIAITALAALSLSAPFAVSAQTLWLCGLSQDAMRLVCVADVDPALEMAAAPVTAVVRGTVFPLDPRRLYTVDLLSPATDMVFVEQLARATICYRSETCSVLMPGAPAQAVSLPR